MTYSVKYSVFCLLVLLILVKCIFQHVQTEIKKKKKKKKKNDQLTQNFEVCYASIRIFSGLKRVLESGYSGHSLHTDIQHYFALRQFLLKKKKKKCNLTDQSLRHLKTNTFIMLCCSWGSDIAFRT